MSDTRIHVGPAQGPGGYDVLVGQGTLARVRGVVPADATRAFILHAAAVTDAVGQATEQFTDAGLQVHTMQVPDGEAAKTAEVLVQAWQRLGEASYTRSDIVVGIGGGAVTDLAGFVAATWLRGVRAVQIPTTLLGMVDAAVGGKTGINIPQGKNLVGAFHPPLAVICDLVTLDTLPQADLTAGLAEVIKCGFIADEQILRLVEQHEPHVAKDPGGPVLRELVERAITVKATVVTQDLTESDLREVLNYGHTFAHAIEQAEDFTWRHGDAVAVGMIFVVELAHAAGLVDDDVVQRHRAVLDRVGLPQTYDGSTLPDLMTVMARDKKARGASIRFVVLTGPVGELGAVGRLADPPQAALEQALAGVRSGDSPLT